MSFIKTPFLELFIDPCPAICPSRGVSAVQPPYEQLRGGGITASVRHILKYICLPPNLIFVNSIFSANQFLIQILSCAALWKTNATAHNILRRATPQCMWLYLYDCTLTVFYTLTAFYPLTAYYFIYRILHIDCILHIDTAFYFLYRILHIDCILHIDTLFTVFHYSRLLLPSCSPMLT